MKPTTARPFIVQSLAASVFGLALSCSLHAQTYSFADDFQLSPTPSNLSTNIWQYFKDVDASRNGSYTLMTYFDAVVQGSGLQAWTLGDDAVPYIGVVAAGSPFFGVPVGSGYVHPTAGATGGLAIGFRAPASGLYDVNLSIFNGDGTAGDGVDWYIDKNSGANNLAFGTATQAHEVDTASISSVALNAGDYLYLAVNANDLNGYNSSSDSTSVNFTVTSVTSVPEPTTFAFGIGLASLTFLRRRRG